MDIEKIVSVTRKIAKLVNKEFPFIFEDDARTAIIKALIDLHYEPKLVPKLFADNWKEEESDDDLS